MNIKTYKHMCIDKQYNKEYNDQPFGIRVEMVVHEMLKRVNFGYIATISDQEIVDIAQLEAGEDYISFNQLLNKAIQQQHMTVLSHVNGVYAFEMKQQECIIL